MELVDGRLILSASDLNNFLECPHLTYLDLEVASGRQAIKKTRTDAGDLLSRKGDEHERDYRALLEAEGRRLVEIAQEKSYERTLQAADQTIEAMKAGPDVVYQGVLVDADWRGIADFLERVDDPSDLGDWSYEVTDTKLARRVKPYFIIQLCFYSELLAKVQGREPEGMHVVLGSGQRESFRLADFSAYYRRLKNRFTDLLGEGVPGTYPHPVAHCGLCRWSDHCDQTRTDDDHLSLVARITRPQIVRLGENGITTVAELARAPDDARPTRIQTPTFERIREQAHLQVEQRESGKPDYVLLEPTEDKPGLGRLPDPSDGDIFFDMEGDPFYDEDGLEYLFGVTFLEDGEPTYRAFWGRDRAEEKQAFESFMDFVAERRERHPDLHVYHYAHYEPTALKRLMGLHATREDELDDLLRNDVLVDLYRIVEQGLRISQPSYSIKMLEVFYMPDAREATVTEGGDSIIQFERWLDEGDDALLKAIEEYNEEDCRSTYGLRNWLLGRYAEAVERFGEEKFTWSEAEDEPRPKSDARIETERLQEKLLEGVPEEIEAERSEDQQAHWLLAQLLDYHRRDAKPGWWEYFRRTRVSTQQELIEADTEALGGLTDTGAELGEIKQSFIHTLEFPSQEHKISAGGAVDPATEKGVNVEAVDDTAGLVQIRRAKSRQAEPLPQALIPDPPFNTDEQQAALRRLAEDVLSKGLEAEGRFRSLRDVLSRELPHTTTQKHGADLQAGSFNLDDAKQLAEGLDRSYLFIQGPPGSGKTYNGAHLILHLVGKGKRVGVSAQSHAVIHNLLGELEKVATKEGKSFRGIKRFSDKGDRYDPDEKSPFIKDSKSIDDCCDPEVNVVAGTAWLFARKDMTETLDYLVIDEAGQISLADALAIGISAENLILLGDPLQLAQVSQGAHPPGAGASVLEHLLGPHDTIPEYRGLFIDHTRRMHPDVCRFISEVVYENRLESFEKCGRQNLQAGGSLTGTGVRWISVEHKGNARRSPEEAEAIAKAIDGLLGGTFTDAKGNDRPLVEKDIMVVAPYNAQVRCLRDRLPGGVRIGTVDKFQGQEAVVVFFSMATSSSQEIPRNVDFLYSRNRLNVAISRARCLGVLVCSPDLLHIVCRSVEQMRLVNALCRLVEMAECYRR